MNFNFLRKLQRKEHLVAGILLLVISLIFFYPVFKGLIPFPGDLLTGAYYPWLDYKWGYEVGVPVKNPAISDVFSVAYPLKNLAINYIKQGEMPLWNPFAFAGSPLLANWQAGVFYPLNIFMLFLENIHGWTVMIMLQPLLSSIFMYLFLRKIKLSFLSSMFGSLVFAFSGYFMIFLEFNYLQAGIWLPLLFYLIESYIYEKKVWYLVFTSITVFMILSAGNFQVSLYSLVLSTTYLICRLLFSEIVNKIKIFASLGLFLLLGVGLIAVQLIPTFELFLNSIRSIDSNIVQQNFGLLPVKSIITFLAPDFFGNPATHNFNGFLYHETAAYFGIIPLIFVLVAIISRRNFFVRFFSIVFVIISILIFDTVVGKLIFTLEIPLISTSYASRALFVLTFCAAILAAQGLEVFSSHKKKIVKIAIAMLSFLFVTFLVLVAYIQAPNSFPWHFTQIKPEIAIRNLLLPMALVFSFLVLINRVKDMRVLKILLIVLTLIDLFRFGWKYTPFVKKELIYPTTPVIDYLVDNSNVFRIEREKTEVLPPNTWILYGLYSISGYDPLVYLPYARFYNVVNGNSADSGVTRYQELGNYNSPLVDLLGIKYLLVAKRENGEITKNSQNISNSISDPKYKKVFEDKTIVVLENSAVLPRAILYGNYIVNSDYLSALDSLHKGLDFRNQLIIDRQIPILSGVLNASSSAHIINYSANKVSINTQVVDSAILMLTDTNYPGWKVYVNGEKRPLLLADGIFKAVVVPKGAAKVDFIFEPDSFKIGVWISTTCLLLLLFTSISFKILQKKKNE